MRLTFQFGAKRYRQAVPPVINLIRTFSEDNNMHKYKISIVAISCLVLVLSFLVFVTTGHLQVQPKSDFETNAQQYCSPVKSGLKFCTNSKTIKVNAGNPFVIDFTVTNMSDDEITVYAGNDINKYNLKVTSETQEVLLTKTEQLMKKEYFTGEEKKQIIQSAFADNYSEDLMPKQALQEKLLMTNIYDFTPVGKYYVEVSRKTRNPNGEGFIELPLEIIEIEVTKAKL